MKLSLAAPKGFSFLETINSHGWKSLEPFQWNAAISTLSRIELFSGYEPVLINITSSGDAIIVEADGPLPELEARQRVSRMLQMDVPIDGFHQYCAERENLSISHYAVKEGFCDHQRYMKT